VKETYVRVVPFDPNSGDLRLWRVVEVVDNLRAAGVDNLGLLTELIQDKNAPQGGGAAPATPICLGIPVNGVWPIAGPWPIGLGAPKAGAAGLGKPRPAPAAPGMAAGVPGRVTD
jgi:hypothetical protein